MSGELHVLGVTGGGGSAASGGVPLPTWLAGTVGGAPNVLAQSPDGKQFYPQLPLRADINAGAGDPSVTRALGYNGSEWLFSLRQSTITPGLNLLLRSTDGYSWSYIANPFSNADGDSISCFCWTGTKWFAGSGRAATEQRVIMSSADGGLTWTTEPSPFDGGLIYGIGWDGQHLVAVGQDAAGDHCLMTSTGNGTWTARATPFDSPGAFNAASSVVSNGSRWVVQGYDAVPSTVTVITAAAGDITAWTGRASPFDTNGAGNGPYGNTSLWDGTKFWLAATAWSPDPQLMSSPDGTTWTSAGTPLGAGVAVTAMGWDGDLLVISGLDSAKTTFLTAWSADGGTTWHKVYPPDPYWSLTSKRQPNAIPAIV